MIRMMTAGESHGKGLLAIVEGLPAGLHIDVGAIDAHLALRQSGYGRGARQKIECDRVELLAGVRNYRTTGAPVALAVWNRDHENWKDVFSPEECDETARRLTAVRPGHADLAGLQKFGGEDARNILERASARETAVRVAAGELCRQYLAALGVRVAGFVRSVGTVVDEAEYDFERLGERSPVLGMMDSASEARACAFLDECAANKDTAGGVAELRVKGLKAGFGSCMTYREKLDARLAAALMSVQAVKGIEVGLGFAAAGRCGSEVHDAIYTDGVGFYRKTNRAGGIEGGMSNGEEIVLRAAMKPIPTLMRGLKTADVASMQPSFAAAERSDVCAVPACEAVLEAALCFELAAVCSERLGGDRMEEIVKRYEELA